MQEPSFCAGPPAAAAIDSHDREQQYEEEQQQKQQQQVPRISTLQLSSHTSANDLWISVHGKVYDVTPWLSSHPGGDIPLLSLAGQDVTDVFLSFHPSYAFDFLPRFLVATLEDYGVSAISSDFRRSLADFKKAGLFRISLAFYLLSALVILALFVLCIVGVLLSKNLLVHLGSAVLLGYMWSLCGWIGHDAGHGRLIGNPAFDTWMELLVGNCLTGISISWWKRNHNAHHISCNSVEYDPDLQYIPLFAVSSKFFSSLYSYFYDRKMNFDSIARLFVSYQHWTFYPVMAVARINLFAQSMILLMSKKRIPNRVSEIAGILIFWIWFSSLLAYLPNTKERVAFLLISFGVTGIQHVQFCLNHFSSPVYEDRPNSKIWCHAQVKGTLNISCPAWMDWFHGGLQHQIEHHLFPRLPRHNLRKISNLVKVLCDKHGLPYTTVSFWEANLMIIQTLRTAALEAKDFSKPVPKNHIWEAINAQG
eukprot:c20518_g1_i1 orf=110-1546(+)